MMGRPPVTVGSSHTRVTEPAAVQLATLTPVGGGGGPVMEQLNFIAGGSKAMLVKDVRSIL